ncbi:MAG: hypothetical protein CMB99_03955 [Flavobacteriaceae bacterium]|nr:hypothetical protein [Flavobacteriaceae bacterium]|tara:strand:- start:57043 stop:57414 length:372 start_codon:yes stop_codon:yes gene_type:complete
MNQDINIQGIENLKKFSDTEPVFMLNLLEYKDVVEETGKTGRDTYKDYIVAARPFFEKIEAEIVFKGTPQSFIIGSNDDQLWDEVLIVKYATKNEFFKLMQFKNYPRALRASALKDSKLIFCK